MLPITTIGYDSEVSHDRAVCIARELQLRVDNQVLPRLSVSEGKLVLLMKNFAPLFVDFMSEALRKRRDSGKKQGLVRACKPCKGVRIFDVTAGWGRDAAVLASFGADVTMVERHPIMAVLLADGLRRIHESARHALALSLIAMDAKQYLQSLPTTGYPDVIYMDPMHPLRQKSALVKKDMQALQQFIGADEDAFDLLHLAMERTRQRVVVKWPQSLAPIQKPTYSVEGKTVRFDVYQTLM